MARPPTEIPTDERPVGEFELTDETERYLKDPHVEDARTWLDDRD